SSTPRPRTPASARSSARSPTSSAGGSRIPRSDAARETRGSRRDRTAARAVAHDAGDPREEPRHILSRFQGVPALPRRRGPLLRRRAPAWARVRTHAHDDQGRSTRTDLRRLRVARRGVMDERLLAVARAAKGFMPDDEGLALFESARDAGG